MHSAAWQCQSTSSSLQECSHRQGQPSRGANAVQGLGEGLTLVGSFAHRAGPAWEGPSVAAGPAALLAATALLCAAVMAEQAMKEAGLTLRVRKTCFFLH